MSETNNTVPLSLPLHGASFQQAVTRFFTKYATFTGRASRSEFWYAYLCVLAVNIILSILLNVTGSTIFSIIAGLFSLAVFIPTLAVMVRRLHDMNYAGWMLLLAFIPFAGIVVLLVFLAMDSKPEGARFDV